LSVWLHASRSWWISFMRYVGHKLPFRPGS
jgi:hypothetical protein